jgi:hypothetical protein
MVMLMRGRSVVEILGGCACNSGKYVRQEGRHKCPAATANIHSRDSQTNI